MNGVKESIITSFEVNTVSTETVKYSVIKSFIWLLPAFFNDASAKNLNTPSSSKNMDNTVIEIKITSILIGFTEVSAVSALIILFKSPLNITRITVPIRVIIQYESINFFPTFIFGKNNTEVIIAATVTADTEMVNIIFVKSLKSKIRVGLLAPKCSQNTSTLVLYYSIGI